MQNSNDNLTKNNNLIIGGISASALVKKFGTPLYVMDKVLVEKTICAYKQAIEKSCGEGGVISYASKAFSCKEIYRIAKRHNISIDVVSMGEIYTALSVGFPSEKMFFHGNNKTMEELSFAIKNKVGTIVVDSTSEVDDIDMLAKANNLVQNVMVRVNPGVEAHTHHFVQTANIDSKFGFSISNGDAENIIVYINSKANIKLIGCHCHIGSQIFEKKSFTIASEKMLNFYAKIKEKFNISFTHLNLGGGFGIKYTEEDANMDYNVYSEYISDICENVKQKSQQLSLDMPCLIFEPGRSIVGPAGTTLYTAGRVKEIKGVKSYVAVDGGMFENPRYALYQAKYTVLSANKLNEKPEKTYTIAGKCCESGDIIAENVLLPKVEKGDIIAVLATGAYNYSMSSNYNRNFVPPVVFVENGKAKYAIKPQSLKDLVRNDI